ncbi:MAG: SpoIIE family protein phosphatase [Sedimentisphaeraceae bacterium JB056]
MSINRDIANTPSLHKKRGSLKRVFGAVLILIYFITAIATLLVFKISVGKVGDQYVKRFALSQNMLEKNRILSLVQSELALSRKLANDPGLIEWMLNEDDKQLQNSIEKELQSYNRFLKSGTNFIAILKTGSYYINGVKDSENTLSPDDPYSKWFYDAIEGNRSHYINVDYNLQLDEVRVWFNVIVRDNHGSPIGMAGSGMDLGNFLRDLIEDHEPGVETIIINSTGQLQAYKDRSLIEHNARVRKDIDKKTIYDLLDSKQDKDTIREAVLKVSDSAKLEQFKLNIGGKKIIATISSIPELGWYNLVLVDGSLVMGLTDFMPIGIIFLISLLAVMFCVLLILNKLVLRPLGRLTDAAGLVAEGAYETSLPPAKSNEIGRLSDSFNIMTAKIKNYTRNLEQMVEKRTEALNSANKELIESQKRITDSIQYAKLIQSSILPPEKELDDSLKDYFTIFQPLDIVGGDFYFFQKTDEGFFVAVVDCTGHGVPGAFMTMMTAALLSRVIETMPHSEPSAMLEKLHYLVQETLRSENDFSHLENGLDIALCKVNLREKNLKFSGAGLGLITIESNNIEEISGDKLHLGFSNSRKEYKFTNHSLELNGKKRYYMLTDGVLDLPGGKKGFGLGRRKLKNMIIENQKVPMNEQKERFIELLDNYRGNYLQRDDVTMIGFEIKVPEDK